MMEVKKIIRPCVRNLSPYVAGMPIAAVKKQFGIKKVVKLASNENPLGPSRKAVGFLIKNIKKINLYPDSDSVNIRSAIARKYGISPKNIIVGSGSDELIEIIAKTFFNPIDEIIVSKHAFIRYKMAGDLMNCKVIEVPMKNFKHALDAMASAVTKKTKAIFVANPNNPTGTYNTKKEVEKFLNSPLTSHLSPLIVIDEAYYEYAKINRDYPETLKYLKKYPNLIILRTFSKIYGLAGLRLGYAFTSKEIIDELNKIKPPFNVSSSAQSAGIAALTDEKHLKNSVNLVEKEKSLLYKTLDKMRIKHVKSAGNFILIDTKPFTGKKIFEQLLKNGVIVRAMDEYELPYHIRLTIGLPSENKLFIKELKKLI